MLLNIILKSADLRHGTDMKKPPVNTGGLVCI